MLQLAKIRQFTDSYAQLQVKYKEHLAERAARKKDEAKRNADKKSVDKL